MLMPVIDPYENMSFDDKQMSVIAEGLLGNPDIFQSVRRNLFNYGSVATPNQDEQLSIYDKCKQFERSALLEMRNFERIVLDQFQATVTRENENMDFFNSNPWSDKEIIQMKNMGINAYQSNTEFRWMMSLLGEQYGTESRFRATGKDPTSQKRAEAQNYYLDWAQTITRWDRHSNYVFRNGSIGGRGVCLTGMDPFDPQGLPLIKRCRPQEFMHDPVGAEDGTLQGSKYLWRFYNVDAEDLIWKYPLFKKEIDSFDFIQFNNRHLYDFTFANPKVRSLSQDMTTPVRYLNTTFRYPRRRISVREFYRRGTRKAYAVYDSIGNVDHCFDTPQHAEYFYQNISQAYAYAIAASGGDPNVPAVAPPRVKGLAIVDQMIWAGDKLIHMETFEGDRFPYHFFIPMFNDGEITGFFEHDKDHQRLRNRMLIYLDMLLSGVKGKTFYNRKAIKGIAGGEKQFEMDLTRATKAIGLDVPVGTDIRTVIHHADAPNHGQLPEIIMKFATEGQSQMLGGLNSIGEAESAGQSGVSIRHLQGAAQTGTLPLFQEWAYFQEEVGEAVSYLSQFISPVRIMATMDERNKPQYSRFLDFTYQSMNGSQERITSMSGMEYWIDMEEVSASPSQKQQQLNLLLMLLHNSPEMISYSFEELADLSGIERSRIERISQKMMQDKQFKDHLAERQQTMLEYKEESSENLRWAEQARKNKETDTMHQPKITIGYTGKMPTVGPGAASTLYEYAGVPATPAEMAADTAFGKLMDQAERVAIQKDWNKNLLPEQKQAMKGKAAEQPKRPATAKDTINRERN